MKYRVLPGKVLNKDGVLYKAGDIVEGITEMQAKDPVVRECVEPVEEAPKASDKK